MTIDADNQRRIEQLKAQARELGWTPLLVAELTAIRAGYLDPPDLEKMLASADVMKVFEDER